MQHALAARDGFLALPKGDPMDVAFSTNGVAGVLEKLGRDDEAVAMMEKAHTLAIEAKGTDDPAVLRAKKNLDGLRAHVRRKATRATAAAEVRKAEL